MSRYFKYVKKKKSGFIMVAVGIALMHTAGTHFNEWFPRNVWWICLIIFGLEQLAVIIYCLRGGRT